MFFLSVLLVVEQGSGAPFIPIPPAIADMITPGIRMLQVSIWSTFDATLAKGCFFYSQWNITAIRPTSTTCMIRICNLGSKCFSSAIESESTSNSELSIFDFCRQWLFPVDLELLEELELERPEVFLFCFSPSPDKRKTRQF